MELTKKLAKIQSELSVPKNQYNSFGKYSYRNCEDILEAVKPLLEGCILTLSDEVVVLGTGQRTPYDKTEYDKFKKSFYNSKSISGGERFYVKATATIKDENESISVSAMAREDEEKAGMAESQITGSASSYARKYALNGLFCIDDAKDADSQDNSQTAYKPNNNYQTL